MRRNIRVPVIVICLVLFLFVAVGLFMPRGVSSEDAWYDVDEDGNFIVSFYGSIFWVDADREHREKLVNGREVSFLPGGEEFLFERDDSIWLFNLRDHVESRVTQPGAEQIDWYPAFCPSLDVVIFARAVRRRRASMGGTTGESFDIYTCGIDGSDVRRITKERFHSLAIGSQGISGNSLYFVGERLVPTESEGEVYRLDIVSGDVTRIGGTKGAVGVSVSHDGLQLAIMRGPEYYSIQLMDLDSETFKMIRITGDEWVNYASFSADDQSVFFLEDTNRSGDIRIMEHYLSDGREVELFRH